MNPARLEGREVAVVGGGLAGIAAALECADRGGRVTVLERQRRLGGLTWSFEHNGLQIDNGQHVFLACCDAYLRFLDRIGSSNDVERPRPLDLPVVAPPRKPGAPPTTGRLRRVNLPVPLHLAPALLRWAHLGVAERLLLGRAFAALRKLELGDQSLDRMSFAEWLADHGQSPAAIEGLWDLVTVPTVNLPAAEASLAMAAMVFKTGLLGRRDAADMGWSRVPLGRLHGARAAAALDRAAVTVRTGVRVTGTRPAAGGWEVVTSAGSVHADSVVVAVPQDEAAGILPAGTFDRQDRWAELGSSAVIDVHLVFERKVTSWPVMAGLRSPVQWVFDRSVSSGIEGGRQYLAVSLSAADALLSERPGSLIDRTREALVALLPAAGGAKVVDALVTKERRATFRAAPGTGSLRPPAVTGKPGLVLAGAWTDTGWPATMEGAVRSGWAAAAALSIDQAAATSRPTKEVA
jgi:squalene-associated FAD-dependent desaturase